VTCGRLASGSKYSSRSLYSHFKGKADIVRAVAMEGFGELLLSCTAHVRAAGSPAAALRGVAAAYLRFAQIRPAVYDAMFVMPIELPFAAARHARRAADCIRGTERRARTTGRRPRSGDPGRGHLERAPRPATLARSKGSAPAISRPASTFWSSSSPGSPSRVIPAARDAAGSPRSRIASQTGEPGLDDAGLAGLRI